MNMKIKDLFPYAFSLVFMLLVGLTTGTTPIWDTILFSVAMVMMLLTWVVVVIYVACVFAIETEKLPDTFKKKRSPFLWAYGVFVLVAYLWAYTSAGWNTFAIWWTISTFAVWGAYIFVQTVLRNSDESNVD